MRMVKYVLVRKGRLMAKKTAFIYLFQAEDGIRYIGVTGVQTCALPISQSAPYSWPSFQAHLAPHAKQMAEALEKMAMNMGRFAPAGRTLRQAVAERLARANLTEGERWDAEAAQAMIDALDAIGSGAGL